MPIAVFKVDDRYGTNPLLRHVVDLGVSLLPGQRTAVLVRLTDRWIAPPEVIGFYMVAANHDGATRGVVRECDLDNNTTFHNFDFWCE